MEITKDYRNCGTVLPGGFHSCCLPEGHDGACKCTKWCALGHDKVSEDIIIKGETG